MTTSFEMRMNPLSFIVFLFGMMSAFFIFYIWRNRSTRGSMIFAVFLISMTVYVIGYSMELASLNVPTMIFWSKVESLGTSTFPTLFLIFVLQYTGRDKWLNWKIILLLSVIPILLIIIKLTNSTFHLVYENTWVDNSGPIPLLGFHRGPLYILASYSILPVTFGVILLLIKRKNALPLYRSQVTLIIISAVSLLLVYILYLIGYHPIPSLRYLDTNAIVFPLWGVWIGLAIFRYGLFNISPAAREALIERMSDAVFVLDHKNRLVDSNPMASKIMGWTQPPIGEDAGQVFSTWSDQWNTAKTANLTGEKKIEIKHEIDGEILYFDLSINPLRNKSGKNIGQLLVLHDITDLKALEQELLELSLVDELTGLNNRRGFYVLAAQFLQMVNRMNSKAALVYMDLDTMKMINDTYGHAEGDQALVETAALLRSHLRSSDILARFGGDEFVALLVETEELDMVKLQERISEQLREFNAQSFRKYSIMISYGVAHYNPQNPISLDELIIQADKAMYEHKQSKKQTGTSG